MSVFRNRAYCAGVLVAVGLGLQSVGCAQNSAAPSSSGALASGATAAMIGSAWQLQRATQAGADPVTVAQPDHFTLQFVDASRLSIRADCNQAAGGYTLNGATLSVGNLAATLAACASAPFDSEYLQLLGGDSTATVTDTSLVLSSSRGTLQFAR
jgi:heat shock protein HslJ